MNLDTPEDYPRVRADVMAWLTPDRLPLLIGIDGADGAGKSSVASWLAWQTGMPVVHLDLYIVRGSDPISWRSEDLRRVIEARLGTDRPMITEGILLLDALAVADKSPDRLIFVVNSSYPGSHGLSGRISDYLARTHAQDRADFIVRWSDQTAPR